MKNANWTEAEHILAFNLYCKIPFSKINANYPPVRDLANILGRSNGSVAMKLANFARLDPVLKAKNISGLTQGAKGEEEIWNRFSNDWETLAWESEQLLAKYKKDSIENVSEIDKDYLPIDGKERTAMVKVRVNQSFFRKMILASYNSTCCITGIKIPELLVASHIIPWSEDIKNRMNPSNGLCLNALHDKAFDKGLITITGNLQVKVSNRFIKRISDSKVEQFFISYNNSYISIPSKFLPSKEFLEYHNSMIFRD